MSKYVKLILLNAVIVIVAVLLYSPGFVGIQLIGGPLATATTITAGIAMLMVAVFGNAGILGIGVKKSVKLYKHTDFDDKTDYLDTVRKLDHRYLGKELDEVEKLIERLEKKINTIEIILLQFFDKEEMSYKNYRIVIDSVSKVFYGNVQNIINRVIIFDPEEVSAHTMSNSCREHVEFVNSMLDNNKHIIGKLDALLIEVSHLTDSKTAVENLPAMHDLEDLINNTKFYN